jgi:hypothetical protein
MPASLDVVPAACSGRRSPEEYATVSFDPDQLPFIARCSSVAVCVGGLVVDSDYHGKRPAAEAAFTAFTNRLPEISKRPSSAH